MDRIDDWNGGMGDSAHANCVKLARPLFLILAAAAALSCRADTSSNAGTASTAELPRLDVRTPIVLDSVPIDGDEVLAVSPNGLLALATSWDSASRVKVFDSSGTLLHGFGRTGDGPGELRNVSLIQFIDDTAVFVGDALGARGVVYSLVDGAASTIPLPPMSFPYRVFRDSIDLFGFSSSGEPQIIRYSPASRESRVLVDESSEPFKRLFSDPFQQNPGNLNLPARVAYGRGVVLGKGMTYDLLFYNSAGQLQDSVHRELPDQHLSERQVMEEVASLDRRSGPSTDPVARSKQLESIRGRVVPHFKTMSGLGVDGAERVWVVGSEGDSAFTDVFAGSQFLGRRSLPCHAFRGSWAMNGNRVALLCELPSSPGSYGVMLTALR